MYMDNKAVTTVNLRFPYATMKLYTISYSNALNSSFIKNMIDLSEENVIYYDDKSDNNEYQTYTFTIPLIAYQGLREVDLEWLIKLWNGEESYYCPFRDRYDTDHVTKLVGFLGIDQRFKWVRDLENNNPQYPPKPATYNEI